MSNPFGPPGSGGGYGQPPSGNAFGPPGGGYPPQGGGYPPQGGGYPPQGGGYPPQGGGFGPSGGGPPPVKINEMPAMIMGIIAAMSCCMPGGVIALLIASQAKTLAVKGDQAGAESKLRLSMMISGGGLVLGFVGVCLLVVFQVLLEGAR